MRVCFIMVNLFSRLTASLKSVMVPEPELRPAWQERATKGVRVRSLRTFYGIALLSIREPCADALELRTS